jgi:prepilin-type N-terminal cleavage/methylation domain-containing protein
MNQKTEQTQNGFSLVELLVAMTILAFGALSLVQLMALGIKVNVQTTDDTQATTLAQWKIETLTGIGYQNLNAGGDLDTSVLNYTEEFHEPQSGVVYTKNWKITPCGHADPSVPCDISEEYFQTPWYEVSVRVYTNRLEKVANTQPRQITIKAQILQPF